MKKSMRKVLAVLISLLGSLLALYIAGYWLFLRPVYWLVTGFTAGTLTRTTLVVSVIKIFIASTVGGGIWCVCDIIASKFRDYPED